MSRMMTRFPALLVLGAALATLGPAANAAGARGGHPSGGFGAVQPRGTMPHSTSTMSPRIRRVVVAPIITDRFFFGPSFGLGFGWGWPYYGAAGWWGPAYPYAYTRSVPGDWAAVELHIHPRKAFVRVDGYDAGEARNFNSGYQPLWLKPGAHTLELSHPGDRTLRIRVNAAEGGYLNLRYSLEEGSGIDSRSVTGARDSAWR